MWLAALAGAALWAPGLVAEEPATNKARPAGPRTVEVVDYLSFPAMFLTSADTLDPAEIARVSWRGWMAKRGVAWGSRAGGEPTVRLSFDCRALPWPVIRQHAVDGPDNNMRSLAAHAALHDMFPDEKRGDPVEEAQVAYLLSCTAPQTALPYTAENIHRHNAIGHGEFVKNLIEMYQYSGTPWYKTWAEQALHTLRRHAVVEERPGVGKVAWYPHGMVAPTSEPSANGSDHAMAGWMHLACGWNAWAFAKWHELTGDEQALDFSLALARRLMHSADQDGNDGSLRPDGSFGGKLESCIASNHMHGHTHGLPGLLLLGKQLHQAGRHDEAAQVIAQAQRTFDWLYDPERNPDAGSWTGWLGEWLMVNTGWDRQADCEGCTMGDVVEAAVGLAAASRQHARHRDLVDYYDRAEEIFRGHCLEQMFTLRPSYRAVLRSCLEKQLAAEEAANLHWPDQSEQKNDARVASTPPVAGSQRFAAGEWPVIKFDGTGYFKLSNSASLRLAQFSAFAVVEVSGKTGTIFSNYNNPINWGKGINLGVAEGGAVYFFTTDGTQENYDPMTSEAPLSPGYRLLTFTRDEQRKRIYADGQLIGEKRAPALAYDEHTVAAIGALREFGNGFAGGIAELVLVDRVDDQERRQIEGYLAAKYGLGGEGDAASTPFPPSTPKLWLVGSTGLQASQPVSSELGDPPGETGAVQKSRKLDARYDAALATAERLVGQQLGACGFPDWVNKLPSDLDPQLPGIHMQGCCADATVRGAHAVWKETVTGDAELTRVNMAFNRRSELVDVVSSLPHRGELNVIVRQARNVLVRLPRWAPRDRVAAYVNRQPVAAQVEDSYVAFRAVQQGDQLTVTYPVRLAVIKETPGSLDGTQYVERWRGNAIVDIAPRGKWIPLYVRPELDTEVVPAANSRN